MNYIDTKKAQEEQRQVEAIMPMMSGLAKAIANEGLLCTLNDVFDIGSNRKTVTSLYVNEATERTKSSPKYVVQDAIEVAKKQAAIHSKEVETLQHASSFVLSNYTQSQFNFDESLNITFRGDLVEYLKKKHTRELSDKQVKLYKKLSDLVKSLNEIQDTLVDAGIRPDLFNSASPAQLFNGLITFNSGEGFQQAIIGRVVFIEPQIKELIKINI